MPDTPVTAESLTHFPKDELKRLCKQMNWDHRRLIENALRDPRLDARYADELNKVRRGGGRLLRPEVEFG